MCDICRGVVPFPIGLPTIDEAIRTIEHSRDTHVQWAEYLDAHPEAVEQEASVDGKLAMATPQFHRHCVVRYDRVLIVLRACRALT